MEISEKVTLNELKRARLARQMTYQEIVDICEKNGEPVSLTTVKRVFSAEAGSGFRYRTTILPIAHAVLGKAAESPPNENADTLLVAISKLTKYVVLFGSIIVSMLAALLIVCIVK